MPSGYNDNTIEQLLADALPEKECLDSWLAETAKLRWDEDTADKSLDKGFDLLKAWNLTPATKLGKGKNAETCRSILAQRYSRNKPFAEAGPDGKPVYTDAAKHFAATLVKYFAAGQIAAALPEGTKDTSPEWEVPVESVNGPAEELFKIMGAAQLVQAEQGTVPRFFVRAGTLVEVTLGADGHKIEPVSAERLPSVAEQYVRPFRYTDKGRKSWTTLSIGQCRILLKCRERLERLPELRVLANAPVLVAAGKQVRVVKGYDAATGILVTGGGVEMDMTLQDATGKIEDAIDEFQWASAADASRSVASFITPALVNGGLLGGRPPVDVSEADEPRTGKGYRQELVALAYNEAFRDIAAGERKDRLEELFDGVLISGGQWPRLDNLRGDLDSQKIESFLTQDSYEARCAYRPVTRIDPRRCILWATSNGMGVTPDLAKRASIVCIRHQEGVAFQDKKAIVRAHQPVFLGAVFRILTEWVKAGRPRTRETRHDFTWWCQPIDYIVQKYFGLPPLIDGHQELQTRVSSVAQTWLRAVAYALRAEKRLDEPLMASAIAAVCQDHDIVIPGTGSNATERSVAQGVGRLMAKAFTGRETVTVDDFCITRDSAEYNEDNHHATSIYTFTPR